MKQNTVCQDEIIGADSTNPYKMVHVPLKVGVKINPDEKYYSDYAQLIYKNRALKLMSQKIKNDHEEYDFYDINIEKEANRSLKGMKVAVLNEKRKTKFKTKY